jgi:Fe2+ or Zn2+ uptake regulation protein
MQEQLSRDRDAAADERLAEALRARGQRVTSQRLVINRLLAEMDRHVTADEILRLAGERLPGMSLPTVYATLDLLAELGLARRVSVGGPVLYDPRSDEHAHVRCRACGKVQDLDTPVEATAALHAARAAGFTAEGAELVVGGLCADCATTAAPAPR